MAKKLTLTIELKAETVDFNFKVDDLRPFEIIGLMELAKNEFFINNVKQIQHDKKDLKP
jgi:hypothetical protein